MCVLLTEAPVLSRTLCSPTCRRPVCLTPGGVKFWKTLLTLAAARWCHFIRGKCCTKTPLVSRTRTHTESYPLLLSWPGGKEKGGQRAAAKRTQPNATCLGSPVAANVVEPSDPDLDGNHCKHFPTRPVEEAASERAS